MCVCVVCLCMCVFCGCVSPRMSEGGSMYVFVHVHAYICVQEKELNSPKTLPCVKTIALLSVVPIECFALASRSLTICCSAC